MKTIAMYLPQFHRVKENDEWWGEGFTEWTAVKRATPMFDGHKQPRIPQDENYYDLLEKETLEYQCSLANTYHIDAFCFYHYWFKDGRRILEKPAENLLKWIDIPLGFCFCWANESWARTWSKISDRNVWSHKFEARNEEKENGVLLEQKYGREEDWKIHFEYLLPFFMDERYLKIDDRPIFTIYKPELIYCLEDMLEYWNRLAKENGLKGIYTIVHNAVQKHWNYVDSYLTHEPAYVRGAVDKSLILHDNEERVWQNVYSYDKVWQYILNMEYSNEKSMLFGGFVDYDDTPRHGSAGSCHYGVTVEKFKQYFEKLVVKNIKAGSELVFLNAWNEWGEGMYLEPDEEGNGYLEAVQAVMEKYKDGKLKDVDYKINGTSKEMISSAGGSKNETQLKKFREYFDVLNGWLYLKEDGKKMETFFMMHGYNKIAVYGAGHLGRHLMAELEGSSIIINYFIDQRISAPVKNIEIKNMSEVAGDVDAIIVTPTFDYNQIKNELKKMVKCPIISLLEIISELES